MQAETNPMKINQIANVENNHTHKKKPQIHQNSKNINNNTTQIFSK